MYGGVRSQENIEWRLSNILHTNGRAVLIIRNPFPALVSSWRHVIGDDTIDPDHEDHYEHFQKSALSEVQVWRDIAVDWLLVGREVMVVHYEDMVRDTRKQLERVLDFLNFNASEDRLKCVESFSFSKYKRRRRGIRREWFGQQLFRAVEEAVGEVNIILKEIGKGKVEEVEFN